MWLVKSVERVSNCFFGVYMCFLSSQITDGAANSSYAEGRALPSIVADNGQ